MKHQLTDLLPRSRDLLRRAQKVLASAALAAYQNHPHHQHVSGGLGALRETRTVLDYETQGDKP